MRPVPGPSPQAVASRQNGKLGGLATARKHGPEFVAERGRRGGFSLVERYGAEYMRFIGARAKRRGWPKGRSRKSGVAQLQEVVSDA